MPSQFDQTIKARFDTKWEMDKATGCWNWKGFINPDGYGFFAIKRKNLRAHAVAKAIYSGVNLSEIPKGMHWDHLCRNRRCVNPEHLELVTHKENCMRGVGISVQNASKTHCKNGHPLVPGNLVNTKNKEHRVCLTCRRHHSREYHRRKKAA